MSKITDGDFQKAFNMFCNLNSKEPYSFSWKYNDKIIIQIYSLITRNQGAFRLFNNEKIFIEIYPNFFHGDYISIKEVKKLRNNLSENNISFEEVFCTIQKYILEMI